MIQIEARLHDTYDEIYSTINNEDFDDNEDLLLERLLVQMLNIDRHILKFIVDNKIAEPQEVSRELSYIVFRLLTSFREEYNIKC